MTKDPVTGEVPEIAAAVDLADSDLTEKAAEMAKDAVSDEVSDNVETAIDAVDAVTE